MNPDDETELVQRLDAAGREVREVLDEARRSGPQPGHERVVDVLYAEQRRTRRTWWRRRISVAALFVVALGLAWTFGFRSGGEGAKEGSPPIFLSGNGGLRDLEPSGVVAAYGTLVWQGGLPAGGRYHVEVRDADGSGRLVAASPALIDPEWTPDTSDWPDAVFWEVRIEVRGVPRGSAAATVELASR